MRRSTQARTLSQSRVSGSFVVMEGAVLKRLRTIDDMMGAGETVTKEVKVQERN